MNLALTNMKIIIHPLFILTLIFSLTLICATSFATPSHFNCIVQDDAGNTIQLIKRPERIISLAPDITENLFAVDAAHQIVGVIKESNYPEAAKHLPIVGSYTGLDLEKIVSLHPDLIIVWGQTFTRQLTLFQQLNIPVYVVDPHHLTDIPHTLQQLGCLTGNKIAAKKSADKFAQQLKKLQQNNATQQPVRVFYQLGAYSLFTINHTSWIDEAITLCGGKNIFADMRMNGAEVTWEAVVMANPEVVINDSGESAPANVAWKDTWQRHDSINAVRQHALFSINPDLIERAGPRLTQGVNKVCHLIKFYPV